jgi:alanyl-tRNA synthetase
VAKVLDTTPDSSLEKVTSLLDELSTSQKQVATLRQNQVEAEFNQKLQQISIVDGVRVIAAILQEADSDTLRQMVDLYRQQYPSKAIAALGSIIDGRPIVIAAVTDDLLTHGLNAIELVRFVAVPLGGGGGGKPNLAQAGGKDAAKLEVALEGVVAWVKKQYNP